MTSDGATTRVVLWFRNDLRLSDNYMVKQAESMAKRTQRCDVLPVYCFDPRTFAPSAWGSPKTGGHRARFQLECVMNLKVRRCFSWFFFWGVWEGGDFGGGIVCAATGEGMIIPSFSLCPSPN